MRPQRIGLIALLTLLATLAVDNFQLIQNPNSKIQSSQVLAQTPDARKAEADRLLQQGIEQYQTSQFEAALKSWEQALIIYRELQDAQAEAATLGHIGLVYFSRKDYAKAIDFQQQSLALAQEIQDQSGQQTSLRSLRNTYEALNNYLRQHPSRFLSISNVPADPDLQASDPEYLGNQALIYLSQGNLNQAIEYQQQSLSLITVTRNNRQKARAKQLLQQGIEKYHARQFEAALQSMKQALAIYQELNERQEEGVTLGYIGNIYYTVGDYDKATESQQRYLTIAREFYNRIREAQALGNIGIGHKGQGDYHSAIYYIEKYLEMVRAIKDRTGEQQALANLGNAYCLIGDCVKAIDYHQDSLALAREIKNRRGEAQALGSLGTAHYVLGDLKRAIDYQRQSLTISREIQDPLAEGQALNNLGLALLRSGNFTEAERTLRTGIQVWESLRAGLGNEEALAIAPMLNTKAIIGSYATKSTITQLMPKARIIHLATHGILDDERGIGSAIALAPDSSYKEEIGKVNGLLTAEEILDMKLNAELVVLSACDTGRGRITGDGVIGLSRSLISAGVPSVLVSLWSVPDAPTAQLMREFYQNWQKNPDKAQALRQAMLTTMKQHPSPKNWAAFTLIGESD